MSALASSVTCSGRVDVTRVAMKAELLRFHEADEAPNGSGLYAWYYRHGIAHRDITEFQGILAGTPIDERRGAVRHFLSETLFGPFVETPYVASLSGQLKPSYGGELRHEPSISGSLIDRLVAEPGRLARISDVLRRCIPEFASPIYIGSAVSLRARLKTHVGLIRKYRESSHQRSLVAVGTADTEQTRDHNFAYEAVFQRRFDPTEMFVTVMEVALSRDEVFDVENVLNRITFPLCGRN